LSGTRAGCCPRHSYKGAAFSVSCCEKRAQVELRGNAGSGLHRVQAKLGTEARVTVVLASELRVRASYAYRKGELQDNNIDEIFADLPKIFAKKD
jgi:hypothetical protein